MKGTGRATDSKLLASNKSSASRIHQFAIILAAFGHSAVGRLYLVRTVLYGDGREKLLRRQRSLQNEDSCETGADRQCKQIAFEHQKSVVLHAPLSTPTFFIQLAAALNRAVDALFLGYPGRTIAARYPGPSLHIFDLVLPFPSSSARVRSAVTGGAAIQEGRECADQEYWLVRQC